MELEQRHDVSVADNRAKRQAEPIHGAKNKTSFGESVLKSFLFSESLSLYTDGLLRVSDFEWLSPFSVQSSLML